MTTEDAVKSYCDQTKRRRRSSFKTIRSEEDCKKCDPPCHTYTVRRTFWDFDECYKFCTEEDEPAIWKEKG